MFLENRRNRCSNPAHGSGRIVQVLSIKIPPPNWILIPPTEVGGYFKSEPFILNLGINSADLKYPLTTVSGIKLVREEREYRKDLKYPPTAVGGITRQLPVIQLLSRCASRSVEAFCRVWGGYS